MKLKLGYFLCLIILSFIVISPFSAAQNITNALTASNFTRPIAPVPKNVKDRHHPWTADIPFIFWFVIPTSVVSTILFASALAACLHYHKKNDVESVRWRQHLMLED